MMKYQVCEPEVILEQQGGRSHHPWEHPLEELAGEFACPEWHEQLLEHESTMQLIQAMAQQGQYASYPEVYEEMLDVLEKGFLVSRDVPPGLATTDMAHMLLVIHYRVLRIYKMFLLLFSQDRHSGEWIQQRILREEAYIKRLHELF